MLVVVVDVAKFEKNTYHFSAKNLFMAAVRRRIAMAQFYKGTY